MSVSPMLLLFVGMLVAGGVAVYRVMADSKRRERLFAAATTRGWTYTPEMPELVGRWRGKPFSTGDNQRARDVLTGTWRGQEFVGFTYSYETHTTDSNGMRHTTTHRFAVLAWSLPTWLPLLEVRPESVLHRVMDGVGVVQDIETESEDFNRAFRVSARDPKYASDVLTPRVMEVLLRGPRLAWRIENGSILTWSDGPLEPDSVDPLLATLRQVVSLIPTFVWKDHGYDPQVAGSGA